MIYIEERDIVGLAKDLPVVHNPCPANKHTERESVKNLLKKLGETHPDISQKFATAIMHPERYNLWPDMPKKDN